MKRRTSPAWSKHTSSEGFTLVELMAVVAIIGVLATIAVVSYRKLVDSSHVSEATHMVQAIRVAQESYRAEAGTYATVSSSLSDGCPTNHAGAKTSWDPNCGSTMKWSALGVHADGPVYFSYATMAGRAGGALPALPGEMAVEPTLGDTPAHDWFVISARGDLNANGVYCTVIGVSWTNDLYIDREGE